MKSIIFFDIDGTIATEDERSVIPQSTRDAIRITREKGNLTFINSGRTAFNISPRVKELGFDGYICGCGTYIEYSGKTLLYRTIEKSECRRIADFLRKCNVTPVYEHRDGYFFDDKAQMSDGLKEFMEVFVDSGIDISGRVENENFGFDKFVIWQNENSDMELFRSEISKNFSIIDRGGGFYENVPLGYSKATGIQAILKELDIPMENAYAIGDSMNDLPMLEAVPNSIAMGGAEQLYPYVAYVTTPIEEDGIANALSHFGLI
ncbi:MAG: HAD-IIB family hydrolase [Ruminococcus sp.]|uniref:HAD-IIB family hydrolase n=1 Tax=Ruminococcus sp. TaxID=41978 RepID=UPI0025D4C31D|nr:HAD-IIB family hydrolase [Ruminococcus sp.]MCR5601821.1 HAD-IIB family hydrolase [Ruminococcus sp.]